MPLTIQCPQGHKINVPEKLAGRNVKCPKCAQPFRIPELAAQPEVAPIESLDFSETPPDPFATTSNDFMQLSPQMPALSNQASMPQASLPSGNYQQHYQPVVSTAPTSSAPEVAAPVSTPVLLIVAGIAFAIGLLMTLGLGLVLI